MTEALPTGLRGRLLALGITMLLVAGAWAGVVQPLVAWQAALTETVGNRTAVARRMIQAIETLPELRRQLRTEAAPAAADLLDGGTDAQAGAALQVRIRELATQAGVNLASAETLPAEPLGGFRRIGVRVVAAGAWPVLVGLLQALDRASPRMLVDDLQLQSALALGGEVTRPLNATLTILAFRAGTGAPPAAAP